MGTTAQKLNKILETKEAIRTAINNKGGTLTTTDTFASYPSAIDSLPSGGNDWLKEYLDETKSACLLFCGEISDYLRGTWYNNLTYERLQKILSYNTTSNVTDMSYMFYYCKQLTTIPLIDTSLVTNMGSMFESCLNLTTIPQLDTSKCTNMRDIFYSCSKLKEIHMIGMKVSFDISYSRNFTESALVEILNNLATVTSTQTLTMGSTNLAKLTNEEKAIATNKGWTLA